MATGNELYEYVLTESLTLENSESDISREGGCKCGKVMSGRLSNDISVDTTTAMKRRWYGRREDRVCQCARYTVTRPCDVGLCRASCHLWFCPKVKVRRSDLGSLDKREKISKYSKIS